MSTYFSTACVLLGAAVCLASCASYGGPVGRISNIDVTETGSDSTTESCHRFNVSPSAVKSFFRRAVLITARQEHDYFLRGPCYVRGTLSSSYETWQWEIRNLGTAKITTSSGDDLFLLADPKQESSLADE